MRSFEQLVEGAKEVADVFAQSEHPAALAAVYVGLMIVDMLHEQNTRLITILDIVTLEARRRR